MAGQVAHLPEVHSNSLGAQNQCPKPRLVHNASGGVQQSNTDDAFNLCSRICLTGSSVVEEMTTVATTSARLTAAEEGLIGHTRDSVQGGCIDPQPLDTSGHQETCLPDPTGTLHDAANPFARPPPPPERLPEPHLGPGVRSFYPPQPDVSQGDNPMKYNTGWYAPHGPYPPMPYMPPHYHHAYPPGNPHGPPFHPQPEHAVRGDPNTSRYHDTYYNGGNGPYATYPSHAHYPFYPPPPPPLRTGLAPNPDGDATLEAVARHPPNNPGGDKEAHPKDTQPNT